MPINVRKRFERIIAENGHWCAFRKFLRGQPRSAEFDDYYEASSRQALQELTAGRPYSDHLTRMYKRTVVPGFEKRAEIGEVATPGIFFYLHGFLEPTPEDWILEIEQNRVRRRVVKPIVPYRVTHIYDIMGVDELRMGGGEIIYFRCRVEEVNIGGAN